GRVAEITPEMCQKLTEPGTIVVDESDLSRLGIKGIGDTAEIGGHRVRVVGLTKGLKSLAGPYVFCSRTTARPRLHRLPDQITYVLGKCYNPADAPKVAARIRKQYHNVSAFPSEEFSVRSR